MRESDPSYRASGWVLLKKNRAAMVSFYFLAVLLLVTLIAPFFFPNEIRGATDASLLSPGSSADGWKFLMGSDIRGRDLFYRVLVGARVSLIVGFAGAFVALLLGVSYGVIAGYIGGKVDGIMMRIVDVLYSIPRLLFLMIFIAAFGAKFHHGIDGARLWAQSKDYESLAGLFEILLPYSRIGLLILALGFIEWLVMARIVRGQVLVIREMTYVKAAKALGQRPLAIIWKHVIPNLTTFILTYLTLTIPAVILDESFLSFLGLGIEDPASSWGSMLREGAESWNVLDSHWWLLFFPAFFMALTMLALNFLGDGLRDAYDPKNQY